MWYYLPLYCWQYWTPQGAKWWCFHNQGSLDYPSQEEKLTVQCYVITHTAVRNSRRCGQLRDIITHPCVREYMPHAWHSHEWPDYDQPVSNLKKSLDPKICLVGWYHTNPPQHPCEERESFGIRPWLCPNCTTQQWPSKAKSKDLLFLVM